MQILHISAECVPAAKAGGLGDVVGALPKYLNKTGDSASVIIPKYALPWIQNKPSKRIFSALVRMLHVQVPVHVEHYSGESLGFDLFYVDIPGFFDRNGVYADPLSGLGYTDETERYLLFQQAVLLFVSSVENKPDILHCHDHHTGLIPFMVKYCPEFKHLGYIPTVFTIHNGLYHGAFPWSKSALMPWYDGDARGLLEWNGMVNPLACAIKCCWYFTTVSHGYLRELANHSNGLESLIRSEWPKASGIINGIDSQTWNPSTDPLISHRFYNDISKYKAQNKAVVCERFKVKPELPLITFIGRLVSEKGADLLPESIVRFLERGGQATFVVLGTGDPGIRDRLIALKPHLVNYFDTSIEYNEQLSHQLYAGSDFLVMPSKVEPCGLNQMYAFRYGTIPIVRATGGLADTVIDIGDEGGNGIRFNQFSSDDLVYSFFRATDVYHQSDQLEALRAHIMNLDFSWEKSVNAYQSIYNRLKPVFS